MQGQVFTKKAKKMEKKLLEKKRKKLLFRYAINDYILLTNKSSTVVRNNI